MKTEEKRPEMLTEQQAAQGTAAALNMQVNAEEATTEKKKQKISVSYTLRAFGENIKKLEEAKMLTTEESETLKGLHEKVILRWIGEKLAL